MSKPNRDQGLLEYLASKAECIYISDLYQPAFLSAVKKAVSDTDKDMFSLMQWNDAAGYISKEKVRFESKEEVVAFLLQL